MAINELITFLDGCGISAITEYPGGTWGHSAEYIRLRNCGKRGLLRMLKDRVAQGDVRASIQLALLRGTVMEETVDGPEDQN